jgi:osomolarity two-component system sensor histidine kinase TcsA
MSIVEVSESHALFSGKTRDSLLHATVGSIEPAAIPVPNFPTLYGALRAACSTKEVQMIEGILPQGKVPYNLRVTPVMEQSKLLFFVLEAQRLTEQAANYQHAYLNATYKVLVDTVKDYAIFMMDTKGHISTWNSGAAILKGYKATEIIGKHFSVFYGPEDRASGKPARGLAVSLREGRMEDEGWRYRADGSRFWANVLITPIYQFGQHLGFVKVTRDLSERKEAEARMIAAFEESSHLKTDFLANISHEIRTPMNGMQISMNLLSESCLTPQQREHVAIAKDSMSHLLRIMNDLLDYTKLSSGSFSLHSDVVDIKEVMDAVIRNCRTSLKAGVELSATVPPGFPKLLRGDPLRYRQVLQNLLDNAVKYTESGYIKVFILCYEDEQHPGRYTVRTEVADTGIGVPNNAVNTLFTPFTRFATSATRAYPGTGLGLSICKSLAKLMEGAVGYSPNPESQGGSIFWFTVKMGCSGSVARSATANIGSPVPANRNTEEELRSIAPQKHILLVEDNLINHTVMLKLLRRLGFERIDGAWNGSEAVRLIKQKPLSYDIVFMDISMPVMDGVTATTQIREMGLQMPIIAITGNVLQGDTDKYMASGIYDCIAKPVHHDQLLNVLWKWID